MKIPKGRFIFWLFFSLLVFIAPAHVQRAGKGENSEGPPQPAVFFALRTETAGSWPGGEVTEEAQAVLSRSGRREETGPKAEVASPRVDRPVLLAPLTEARLTSPFGWRGERMHWGIDLAAPEGKAVRAAADGEVVFAGWATGYGMLVVLEHEGFRTYYAHNSVLTVKVKDKVMAGEVIAAVGRTGQATGNHLHFELEIEGEKVNPLPYFTHRFYTTIDKR